jgi:hypothetical protein
MSAKMRGILVLAVAFCVSCSACAPNLTSLDKGKRFASASGAAYAELRDAVTAATKSLVESSKSRPLNGKERERLLKLIAAADALEAYRQAHNIYTDGLVMIETLQGKILNGGVTASDVRIAQQDLDRLIADLPAKTDKLRFAIRKLSDLALGLGLVFNVVMP